MNKTKEEILKEHNLEPSALVWDNHGNRHSLTNIIDLFTTHLTDQIKSMENLENKVKEYEELMMDLEDSYMDWIDAEGTQNDGRFSVEVNNIRIKAKALTN